MKIIVGNWKMHGTQQCARELLSTILRNASGHTAYEVVVCPPTTLLSLASEVMRSTWLTLGAQDCSSCEQGAYTGDVSAAMIKDAGCEYVILGHSERRTHHDETNAQVNEKALSALQTGLVPILCVGESQEERDNGQALEVVATQVKASVPAGVEPGQIVLAYEPVWAIGSGRTPTTQDIAEMHHHIVSILTVDRSWKSEDIRVIYGGSVKAANARAILHLPHVSGVLVGGASLKADEFCQIITSVV